MTTSAPQFERLFDGAPDAMIAVGPDGRIMLVNAEAVRLFGYPREHLLGQSVDMLVAERSRGGHRARRGRFVAAPTTRRMGRAATARDRERWPRVPGRDHAVERDHR